MKKRNAIINHYRRVANIKSVIPLHKTVTIGLPEVLMASTPRVSVTVKPLIQPQKSARVSKKVSPREINFGFESPKSVMKYKMP